MDITENEARIGKAIAKILSRLVSDKSERIVIEADGTVTVISGKHYCCSGEGDGWDGTVHLAYESSGDVVDSVETAASKIEKMYGGLGKE